MLKKIIKKVFIFICLALMLNVLFSTSSNNISAIDFEKNECSIENKIEALSKAKILKINSSKKEIISSIIDDDVFNIDGTVLVKNSVKKINDYYNFDKKSKYDIASWLCEEGIISYQDRIESYCDLLSNKNFKNTSCLTMVYDELREYYESSDVKNDALSQKVENVLFQYQNDDTDNNYENLSSYQSDNFIIYYDEAHILQSRVQNVANYCETIRQQFINYGFRAPILQENYSKYRLILDYNHDEDYYGITSKPNDSSAGTCTRATYIVIYNFSVLNDDIKEVIVHEYFHAIQSAYNYQSGWFAEAFATWAATFICDEFYLTKIQIYRYIDNLLETSITETSTSENGKVYSVLFPITIENEFGGINTVKSIYEEYNAFNSIHADFSQLKTIVTNGISANSSGSFEDVYIKMAAYLTKPYEWYSYYLDYDYSDGLPLMRYLNGSASSPNNSVDYYASNYYKTSVPSSVNSHSMNLTVNFDSSGGKVQIYTIDSSGNHNIIYGNVGANNQYSIDLNNVGSDIVELYAVVSNVNNSGSINYSISTSYINHNYNHEYDWLNYTKHKAFCCCGISVNQGHVVSSDSFTSGDRFATCLLCNGQAEIGFIITDRKLNGLNMFNEGDRYILPNGVIILIKNEGELSEFDKKKLKDEN